MRIIADTNIFLAVVLNEPEKLRIVELSRNCEVCSPDILSYEIANALSAIVKRKQLRIDEALNAFRQTQSIPIKLVSPDIGRALEIALKFNIYSYDAFFLQSALSLGCPLLTLDQKMNAVATQLGISVLE